jgi:hypothetical protein
VFPWTRPVRAGSNLLTGPIRTSLVPIFLVVAAMIAAVAIFARRNLRAGRGDRRGAFRLSAFVFATMFLAWFFGESHVATLWEVVLVTMALSWALLTSGFCWLAYVAVEPFVRRRWPEVLVSWARLLGGEFRDPLVGRELLVGCVGGIALALIGFAGILLPGWLGLAPELIPADLIASPTVSSGQFRCWFGASVRASSSPSQPCFCCFWCGWRLGPGGARSPHVCSSAPSPERWPWSISGFRSSTRRL